MVHADIPFDLSLIATAVEATKLSFIIADHRADDDPIIFCNTAFERLTGYSRKEILGKNCRFLQGDDRDQPALNTLRSSIKSGQDCTLILRNYRKDGSAFRNELVLSPVYAEDNTITHLIGIQRDLSAASGGYDIAELFHHEWHTPLTVIKMTLQILQQHGLTLNPEFLNNSLEAAVKAVDRLESLAGRSKI